MYHGCVTSLSDNTNISVLVSAECLFFSLRFPWFWQAWFSVETWAFWCHIMRLQISFKLVPGCLSWHCSAEVGGGSVADGGGRSPGAPRSSVDPRGMAPVLTAGQWGRWESECPLGLHWGPRRCDPPAGREDPFPSAALSTLAGSLRPQEEGCSPLWASAVLGGSGALLSAAAQAPLS